jgi:squalene-hopene/tetraprenyl-beta-curcumene cyclase
MSKRLIVLPLCLCATIVLRARGEDPAWDKEAARRHFDQRLEAWSDWSRADRGAGTQCVSCHTALPLALARPLLGEAGNPEISLVANVRTRVSRWEEILAWEQGNERIRPYYGGANKPLSLGTESVLNALVLVNFDLHRNGGQLTSDSRSALSRLWSTQTSEGCWSWLNFGLPPWELDAKYYGAALAAGAVGKAGPAYYDSLSQEERPKLEKLRGYLRREFDNESLHNRLWALWASSYLPESLTKEQRNAVAAEALQLGGAAEAWSLTALAKKPANQAAWPRVHSIPGDAPYDGYATALVVHALKRAGVPADTPRLAQATAWLARQRVAEGQGPAMYLNAVRDPNSRDVDEAMKGRFMRDAAAALAVLALAEGL